MVDPLGFCAVLIPSHSLSPSLSHEHKHSPLLGVSPGFQMHGVSVAFNGMPLYLPQGKRKPTISTLASKLIQSLTEFTWFFLPLLLSTGCFAG